MANGAGFKINIQIPVAFLYADNKHTEKEIREKKSYSQFPRRKGLIIILTKEVKDSYNETLKLLGETKADTR